MQMRQIARGVVGSMPLSALARLVFTFSVSVQEKDRGAGRSRTRACGYLPRVRLR